MVKVHDDGPDVTVEDHGWMCVVQPETKAAWDWLAAKLTDETTWWGGGLVVEHAYLKDLVFAMEHDDLEVEGMPDDDE